MSGIEIAALIAACAFVVLVIFIGQFLSKASKTIEKATKTLDETNQTITSVTMDVNVLTHQLEELLVKSNELLNDVTQKVEKIDPLFDAAAELGESISDLNSSGRNVASKVGFIGKNTAKATLVSNLGKKAFRIFRK